MSNLNLAIKALLGVASTYLLFKFKQQDLAPKSPNETILKKLMKVIGENKKVFIIGTFIVCGVVCCIFFIKNNSPPLDQDPNQNQIQPNNDWFFGNFEDDIPSISSISSTQAQELTQLYQCAISNEPLNDPVRMGCCDKDYERSNLQEWINKNGFCKFCKSPKGIKDIQQNNTLKKSIEYFRKRMLKKYKKEQKQTD